MKKTLKKLAIMLIVVVMLATTVVSAFAAATIPEATSDFYVNDFAKVFTQEQKDKLMQNAVSLASEDQGVQVVITTVETLNGETAADYAYDMYNKYGIGKDDMGLLILLATKDREIRVEVGKAMEGYISDSKAGRFIDNYAISYLADNKFDEGLISLQDAFIKEIRKQVSSEKDVGAVTKPDKKIDFTPFLWVLGIVAIGGVIAFAIIFVVKKFKQKKEYVEQLETKYENVKKEKEIITKEYNSETQKLQWKIGNLEREQEQLESELKAAREKHNRVTKIYPDAEQKIQEMIKAEKIASDKYEANEMDRLISKAAELIPSAFNVDEFYKVLNAYSRLTREQKQYVSEDISVITEKHEEALSLRSEYERKLEEERLRRLQEERQNKAASVTKQILAVIAGISIARAMHLPALRGAMNLYENLNRETRALVDQSVISELEALLAQAKRDKDEEEAAERRRRQNSYSSSSSYRGSSFSSRPGGSFGGFGGRTGGGGAGRKF